MKYKVVSLNNWMIDVTLSGVEGPRVSNSLLAMI